jgi:hypothetical protein
VKRCDEPGGWRGSKKDFKRVARKVARRGW